MSSANSSGLPWDIQKIMLVMLFVSNFLPFYITSIVFAVVFTILAAAGKFNLSNSPTEVDSFISIFVAFSFLVSLIFHNWVGAIVSVGYIFVVLFFNYYQQAIRPYLVEELFNITLIASFFVFIFAVLEHFNLVYEWDYTFISEAMSKTHADRVEGTFFNPNYYAMMLEFFVVIGLYKLVRTKKLRKKITYLLISLCNLAAIYFTGSRTSYVVVLISVFIFFYVVGHKKLAIGSVIGLTLLGVIAFFGGWLPRMDNLIWAFEDRFFIWQTAWAAIQDNIWFGRGPLAFMTIYAEYGGKYTQHAHNIVLDTILNYGLLGTAILMVPISRYAATLNKMRRYPELRLRLALICSLISVVITHGITDVTIFWLQTGLLFLYFTLPANNMLREVEQRPANNEIQ